MKNPVLKPVLALSAGLIIGGFVHSTASANSHLNCQAYAQSVIDQVNESNKWGCGYSGAQWNPDFNFHFNWCNQGTTQIHHLGEQENFRKAKLHECKLTKPGSGVRPANAYNEEQCHNYAKQMVGHAKTNVTRSCGINDPRMHQNYEAHWGWCFNGRTKQQVRTTLDEVIASIDQCGRAKNETKKFMDSGVYSAELRRNLPLDICIIKGQPKHPELYGKCGKPTADIFCKSKGYQEAIKYPTIGYYNGSNMDGERPSTWWLQGKKPCHGRCRGFSSITCRGKL